MWILRALAANCATSGTLSTTNVPPTFGSSETDNIQWLTTSSPCPHNINTLQNGMTTYNLKKHHHHYNTK